MRVTTRKGRSAITALANSIVALNALSDGSRGTTLNVGVISGGSAANVVADHAVAELDVRFWENDEYDRVNQALEALCEKAFRRRDDDADAGQSQTGDGSKRCDSGTDAAG